MPSPPPAQDGDTAVTRVPTAQLRPPRPVVGELLRSTFPADPAWATAVRHLVTERLAALMPHPERLDDAATATGELFANAVRHASRGPGDTVTVAVECTEHTLRVFVADRSPEPPRPRPADEAAESGRGLAIVSALADSWGTAPPEPGTPGKRVWFAIGRRETTA
ncbi:ATP-binding protein [Streptomyces sediminimaris]|uniref:ATP-binding protein n=1 Tax=Streptomyces sediminimaris TaxID=3383721 RepID=UPI00399A8E9C